MAYKHFTPVDEANLQTLGKFLTKRKLEGKYRYNHLAKTSGLARCSVSKIVRGKQDICFTTLLKLLKAMDIEITFKEKIK